MTLAAGVVVTVAVCAFAGPLPAVIIGASVVATVAGAIIARWS